MLKVEHKRTWVLVSSHVDVNDPCPCSTRFSRRRTNERVASNHDHWRSPREVRPVGFIHVYHEFVEGLGSFSAVQLPPSLISRSELPWYLHKFAVFVSQIEEAGDSDEKFIAVMVPFKNSPTFVLLAVHICKKEKKNCIYIYIFDSWALTRLSVFLDSSSTCRCWLRCIVSIAKHARFTKMEIRSQFWGVSDLRCPVLCFSQANVRIIRLYMLSKLISDRVSCIHDESMAECSTLLS